MPRFTKSVIQTLLNLNEGFERTTYFKDRNFKETIHYKIKEGKLFIRRSGDTSWADSKFDKIQIADIEQTRRFLKKFFKDLFSKGIE